MNELHIFKSHSVEETQAVGRHIANRLNGNEVIGISGDLGAGKTQLVKGICSYFGIDSDEVSSPTFSIVNEYDGNIKIYHFDFYRIKSEDELWDIGIEDYFTFPGLKLIEWFELAPDVMPETFVKVQIQSPNENERKIDLTIP